MELKFRTPELVHVLIWKGFGAWRKGDKNQSFMLRCFAHIIFLSTLQDDHLGTPTPCTIRRFGTARRNVYHSVGKTVLRLFRWRSSQLGWLRKNSLVNSFRPIRQAFVFRPVSYSVLTTSSVNNAHNDYNNNRQLTKQERERCQEDARRILQKVLRFESRPLFTQNNSFLSSERIKWLVKHAPFHYTTVSGNVFKYDFRDLTYPPPNTRMVVVTSTRARKITTRSGS